MSHLNTTNLTETQKNLIKVLEEKGTTGKSGFRFAEKDAGALIEAAGSTVEEFERVDNARNAMVNALHHLSSEKALTYFNESAEHTDYSVDAHLGKNMRYQDEYSRVHGEGDKQVFAHHRPVVSHTYEDMQTRVTTVTTLAKTLLG